MTLISDLCLNCVVILIAYKNEIREEKYILSGGNLKDKNKYRTYDIYLVPELVKKYNYR